MSIVRKVKAVERIFHELQVEIDGFKGKSGIRCTNSCARCCTKPFIEASPLEFLPFAYNLFKEKRAEEYLKILKESGGVCINYLQKDPDKKAKIFISGCANYQYRGLVCRLFGFAAYRNKYGVPELSTCTIIKQDQQLEYQSTVKSIKAGMKVPVYADWYRRLMNVDYKMGSTFLPINEAIVFAIESVLQYYAYRRKI